MLTIESKVVDLATEGACYMVRHGDKNASVKGTFSRVDYCQEGSLFRDRGINALQR